jgi:hypothetical protein
MSLIRRGTFARKTFDVVTKESIIILLKQKKGLTFPDFFVLLFARLKECGAASGGEEMIRLRAYDKIQELQASGYVTRVNDLLLKTEKLKELKKKLELEP